MSEKTEDKGKPGLHLETLLWGGDEIMWVVPAWKGWELAEWFFRVSTELRPDLTYGCGLVFCHTKAPIKNIVALAKRLGDRAKDAGKATNNLAYEVLESLDDVTSDFDEHRAKCLPKDLQSCKIDPLVFDATQLAPLLQALRNMYLFSAPFSFAPPRPQNWRS